MKLFALGEAGKAPILIVSENSEDLARAYAECSLCLEIPAAGNYIFSEDGFSISLVQETDAEKLFSIRAKRTGLLMQTDWTQLPDVPENTKALWADYRQELRDITTQTDLDNIVWPVPPTESSSTQLNLNINVG